MADRNRLLTIFVAISRSCARKKRSVSS